MAEFDFPMATSVSLGPVFAMPSRVVLPDLKEGKHVITLSVDDRNRLHCETGPALTLDGKPQWSWHGVEVPRHVVESPEAITVKEIDEHDNSEVRRVMIERYGQARYLADCNAKLLHKDSSGELYEKRFAYGFDREPVRFVKVKNSTPEPDGSFKDYFLRTPPSINKAKEAVAWTFRMGVKDYSPDLET